MTITELERTDRGLAAIDAQLVALPVRGRIRQEIEANRTQIAATAQLVALALREARAAAGAPTP